MNQQVFEDCTFRGMTARERAEKASDENWKWIWDVAIFGDRDRIIKLIELAEGIPTENLVVINRDRYYAQTPPEGLSGKDGPQQGRLRQQRSTGKRH